MLEFPIKTILRDSSNSLNFILPSFNLLTCSITEIENPEENFYFNYEERKELCDAKNKINDNNFNKDWDKSKKISNLYELIHISNNKMKNLKIFWKMIQDFTNKQLKSTQLKKEIQS